MSKFSKLIDKIRKKGYIFDPKKKVFHPSGNDKNKICYNCGENGLISPNCFKPIKRRSSSKNKQVQESSDDEEDNHKCKNKSYEKKSYNKKSKHFTKKKSNTKRSFVVELKNRSPMSPQVKMSQVKMNTLLVLPSPTIKFHFHHRLCASWLKVTQR
jgi:hypothetical protein